MEPVTENEEEAPAAYAGGQVSTSVQLGVLGDRPTLDVPFNITGYTNKMMEDNQVATVDDVIVHDPSVSDQTLSGVSSAWNIRGFKAQQQDVQLNGLYGIAPRFYGGVEGVDRVDVLKGPSAILAGIASISCTAATASSRSRSTSAAAPMTGRPACASMC